ncbi:hypothetical protein CYMTET_47643 [Cymbomonas tetramitiformis]|uniref:Uncharacterized protein n=1 Tax=Cymbomonas tetramitiformis TaxID=36881 RepID=A0AAE0BVC5_9CHLO|nr:hypothetical protein CYMTET_47643 [Cymbomonas tetramitiformis]
MACNHRLVFTLAVERGIEVHNCSAVPLKSISKRVPSGNRPNKYPFNTFAAKRPRRSVLSALAGSVDKPIRDDTAANTPEHAKDAKVLNVSTFFQESTVRLAVCCVAATLLSVPQSAYAEVDSSRCATSACQEMMQALQAREAAKEAGSELPAPARLTRKERLAKRVEALKQRDLDAQLFAAEKQKFAREERAYFLKQLAEEDEGLRAYNEGVPPEERERRAIAAGKVAFEKAMEEQRQVEREQIEYEARLKDRRLAAEKRAQEREEEQAQLKAQEKKEREICRDNICI